MFTLDLLETLTLVALGMLLVWLAYLAFSTQHHD